MRIVGNECIAVERELNSRMPPALDLQHVSLLKHRSRVALMGCDLGEAQQHIDLSDRPRRRHQLGIEDAELAQEVGVDAALNLLNTLRRAQNAGFLLCKHLGHKAFGTYERLLE